MQVKIRLLELMAQKNIRHVASLARKAEVSDQTLNNIIKGNTKSIRLDTVVKLCKALDCEIDDLIHVVKEEV